MLFFSFPMKSDLWFFKFFFIKVFIRIIKFDPCTETFRFSQVCDPVVYILFISQNCQKLAKYYVFCKIERNLFSLVKKKTKIFTNLERFVHGQILTSR